MSPRAKKKTTAEADALPGKLKAISDPTRLKILLMLEGKPRTVNEIVDFFDLAQPTISRHLQTLSAAGLVSRSRKGQQVIYSVAPDMVRVMCVDLASCFPACCETVIIRPIAVSSCCGSEETGAAKKKRTAKKSATRKSKAKTKTAVRKK